VIESHEEAIAIHAHELIVFSFILFPIFSFQRRYGL